MSTPTKFLSSNSHWMRIALIFMLYVIQGLPVSLGYAISFLLQDRLTYSQQSLISMTSIPFAIKLFWAPLVDALYLPHFGRRKTWIIPLQLFMACLLLFVTYDNAIERWTVTSLTPPNVQAIFILLLLLYFICATQDIAIDALALTWLPESLKGYASICNSTGQSLGFLASSVVMLLLIDPESCNKHFRSVPSETPIITLSQFLRYWSYYITIVTLLVILLVDESRNNTEKDTEMNTHFTDSMSKSEYINQVKYEWSYAWTEIKKSYVSLYRVVMLKPVIQFSIVLLTCRTAFGAIDGALQLKLVEYGIPKSFFSYGAPVLIFASVLSPLMIQKKLANGIQLCTFSQALSARAIVGLCTCGILPLTAYLKNMNSSLPTWFFIVVLCSCFVYTCLSDIMFVSQMAFCVKVADSNVGGTYMTYLNAISNLGARWPIVLNLWLLDFTSIRNCTKLTSWKCPFEGYYVQVALGTLIAYIWIRIFKPILIRLENLDNQCWHLNDAKAH